MPNSYNFDGPVNPKFDTMRDSKLAGYLIKSFDTLGHMMNFRTSYEELMGTDEDPEEHTVGHRIASWVEDPDQCFGHVLAVSEAVEIPNTIDDFSINSVFYRVDRRPGQIKVLDEDTKAFSLKTSEDNRPRLDSVLETFDKYEMAYTISMLGKMMTAFSTKQQLPCLEPIASCGVQLKNIDAFLDTITERPEAS